MPTYSRYYPAGWRNKPDTSTAITAAALDHFDDGLVNLQSQFNAGFTITTVANKAALASLANTVLVALTSDTRIIWIRETVGGPWRRHSYRFEVPDDWAQTGNPSDLTDRVQAVIFTYAGVAYQQGRTGIDATATLVGLPSLEQGLGLQLYFANSQVWHFGPPTVPFGEVALMPKRPWIPLLPGVTIDADPGTRWQWHGTVATPWIGTTYRNYSEHATREDGTTTQTTPWTNSSTDQAAVRSGGTGQAATGGAASISFRPNETARSVITGNYPRATGMTTTVNVDDVWGRDKPWWDGTGTGIHGRKTITTAIAIPAALTANKWKVGDWAAWPQGMNPNDGHERRYISFVQIIAINGVTTPGYSAPAEGAGTFTLGAPVVEPVTIADEFWEFPLNPAGGYAYLPAGSGGIENVESHTLYKISMARWAHKPSVRNIDFVMDPAATKWPTSCVQFAACTDPIIENCRVFEAGVQLSDFNGGEGVGTVRNCHVIGANSGSQTTGRNNGMLGDSTTWRGVSVEDCSVRGRLGPAWQSESWSYTTFRNLKIIDTNAACTNKAPLLGIGESHLLFEGETLWIGAGGVFVSRGASDDVLVRVQIKGAFTVVATDPTASPRVILADCARDCAIDYDGWSPDGTTRRHYKFDAAYKFQERIVLPCTGTGDQTATLPAGAIRDVWMKPPASVVGVTAVVASNGGITNDVSLVGTKCTHVTAGATSSDGSDDGTDADRTWTSSTTEFPAAATAGDSVLAVAANPDGSDFATTVKSLTDTGHVIVNDLPSKAITSGTVVWIGQPVVAGKWTRLNTFLGRLWGGTTKFNFTGGKLEGERSGTLSTVKLTLDGTQPDTTDDWEFLVELYPVSTPPEGQAAAQLLPTRPALTGDARGNPVVISQADAGRRRGLWRNQTTNSGIVEALGHQQAAATMVRSGINSQSVNPTAGTPYVWPFTVPEDMTLATMNLLVGAVFTGCTLARMQVGTYNEGTGTFTPLAESADQHVALAAAAANAAVAFALSNTGRLAATPTSLALKRGTRYAYSFVHVGSAGTARIHGNNQLTSGGSAAATPAVVRLTATGQTDAPTVATVTSGAAPWGYAWGT